MWAFLSWKADFWEIYNLPILTGDFMMETFGRISPNLNADNIRAIRSYKGN
jgi:hypothetical protein